MAGWRVPEKEKAVEVRVRSVVALGCRRGPARGGGHRSGNALVLAAPDRVYPHVLPVVAVREREPPYVAGHVVLEVLRKRLEYLGLLRRVVHDVPHGLVDPVVDPAEAGHALGPDEQVVPLRPVHEES